MNRRTNHAELAHAHRIEASELVRRAAEPCPAGERIKAQITRAASRLGFPRSRTEDIWRLEAKRIDSWEMDLLRKFKRIKRKRH